MSNTQKSSVEWLISQFDDLQYNPLEKNGYENAKNRLREQAKEMEKQRMFDFAKSFVYTWNYITKGNFESTKDMNKELENLFEETYG